MINATDTAPPIPSEVDLTDFAFMPLEVARLRRSKAWLHCKKRPELAFYMLNLWTAAWHDRPAGSLEADDEVLADLAMATPERWKKARDAVLRGWKQHSDGRIYHPVVTEKVLEAWQSKLNGRARTLRGRIASLERKIKATTDENAKLLMTQQLLALSQELPQDESLSLSHRLSQSSDTTQGEEREKREEKVKGEGDSKGKVKGEGEAEAARVMTAAGEMAGALVKLGVGVTSINPTLLSWIKDGFTTAQLVEAAQLVRNRGKTDIPANYLDRIIRDQGTSGAPRVVAVAPARRHREFPSR